MEIQPRLVWSATQARMLPAVVRSAHRALLALPTWMPHQLHHALTVQLAPHPRLEPPPVTLAPLGRPIRTVMPPLHVRHALLDIMQRSRPHRAHRAPAVKRT